MRLLHAESLELDEFFGGDIPKYAILSHTWGDDEVTFQDITSETNRYAKGFRKIQHTARQALEDGWKWIWIDTCCIDKKSSAELSEAINSMFEWYSHAMVCYAYLDDVECRIAPGGEDATILEESRWITRGWTLQELIAPRDVVFFDSQWKYIAKRTNVSEVLASITGIPEKILRNGGPEVVSALVGCSVAQRLSWAAERETTRFEDCAYSLLGVFQVSMPLLYGEGSKAFQRLQEEILKNSTDLSILAWSWNVFYPYAPTFGVSSLLANDLQDFKKCGDIELITNPTSSIIEGDVTLTNLVLRITARIVQFEDRSTVGSTIALLLNCRLKGDITTVLALYLRLASVASPEGWNSRSDIIECVCETEWNRIGCIDALTAINQSQLKSLAILKDRWHDRTSMFPDPWDCLRLPWKTLPCRYLWLRLLGRRTDPQRLTCYPQEHWHSTNLTFDLEQFRYAGSKKGSAEEFSTHRDLYGAIALNWGMDLAIWFCYQWPTEAQEDNLIFSLGRYEQHTFGSMPKHLKNPVHSLRSKELYDEGVVSVSFQTTDIFGDKVVILHVTFTPNAKAETSGRAEKGASSKTRFWKLDMRLPRRPKKETILGEDVESSRSTRVEHNS